MWSSYLKVAARSLLRHRGYSAINLAGLTAGLACAVLILLWVQDEMSFDRFHRDAGQLYRIVRSRRGQPPDGAGHIIPNVLTPVLAGATPEVAGYTRIHRYGEQRSCILAYGERRFFEPRPLLVDPAFFELFTFLFVAGDPQTALSTPHAVVLSAELAEKYFGDEAPLGKVLELNNETELTVTGVVRVPHNSHLQFDFVAPIGMLGAKRLASWDWECSGYVRLKEGASPQEVNRRVGGLMKRSGREHEHQFLVGLEPVTGIHLYRGDGDIQQVYVFSAIAALVLLMACINYTNLTTARYSRRAREVGMRKVVGARRTSLIAQFVCESVLLSLLSALLAAGLAGLALPTLNRLTEKQLALDFVHNGPLSVGLLGMSVLVGVVSAIYPALFVTSCRPVRALKGSPGENLSTPAVRRVLVIAQFAISVALIVGAVVVRDQHAYMRDKELGLTRHHVVHIPINDELREGYEAYRSEVLQDPQVLGITFASSLPADIYQYHFIDWDGKQTPERSGLRFAVVDPDYIPTFEIEMIEGRNFARDLVSDRSNFVVNRMAVEYMGLDDAIGTRMTFQGIIEGQIIGVIDDFHLRPLAERKGPLLLTIHPDNHDYFLKYIFFRIRAEDVAGTLRNLERITRKHAPGYPFACSFLDDSIGARYRNVEQMGRVLDSFTGLAILISCLGVLGLAAVAAEQRTKEIGIRKVLGASVASVVRLLSIEFLRLVALANLIAWPVAYLMASGWLDSFAYRVDLGVGTFAASGFIAVALALGTVMVQAMKAAIANPADVLRSE